ncbi:hypothetical protein RBB50_012853 [Rhinocladiella similis]
MSPDHISLSLIYHLFRRWQQSPTYPNTSVPLYDIMLHFEETLVCLLFVWKHNKLPGREEERDIEKIKEEEVRAAYGSLIRGEKQRETTPVGLLAGQSFKLFCSDHVDRFCPDLYARKGVEFCRLDDTNNTRLHKQKPAGEADILHGGYLHANANCNFGPPPSETREPESSQGEEPRWRI